MGKYQSKGAYKPVRQCSTNFFINPVASIKADQYFEYFAHGDLAEKLPDIHKDPFDRMLVAQAMNENLTLVTRDQFIPQYACQVLKT